MIHAKDALRLVRHGRGLSVPEMEDLLDPMIRQAAENQETSASFCFAEENIMLAINTLQAHDYECAYAYNEAAGNYTVVASWRLA
jgi:hypothetical protein